MEKNKEFFLYRHLDKNGKLLYVGVTENLTKRGYGHKYNSSWFKDIAEIKVKKYKDRIQALKAERDLIFKKKPLNNKAHKDRADTHLFIKIDPILKATLWEEIKTRKKDGRLPKNTNLSSVVRGLMRAWIKKHD